MCLYQHHCMHVLTSVILYMTSVHHCGLIKIHLFKSLQFHNWKTTVFYCIIFFLRDMEVLKKNFFKCMADLSVHKPCWCLSLSSHPHRQHCCNSTTGEPGQHSRKFIHWEMSKMQRYVHCKLREFCKEASILKGYGTKNKCSVLFLEMNQWRQEAEELL